MTGRHTRKVLRGHCMACECDRLPCMWCVCCLSASLCVVLLICLFICPARFTTTPPPSG